MDDELEERLKQLESEREALNAQLSASLEILQAVESDIEDIKQRQLNRLQADERVDNQIVDQLADQS